MGRQSDRCKINRLIDWYVIVLHFGLEQQHTAGLN